MVERGGGFLLPEQPRTAKREFLNFLGVVFFDRQGWDGDWPLSCLHACMREVGGKLLEPYLRRWYRTYIRSFLLGGQAREINRNLAPFKIARTPNIQDAPFDTMGVACKPVK